MQIPLGQRPAQFGRNVVIGIADVGRSTQYTLFSEAKGLAEGSNYLSG